MSDLFMRNRYLLWITVIVLMLGGTSALMNLPRLEDPRITNRNAIVLTRFPGASARRVETEVTDPLEDALQEIAEIEHITSTSRPGMSTLSIELVPGVTRQNNQEIFSEIRDEIGTVEPRLPSGARNPRMDEKRGAVAYTRIAGLTWTGKGSPKVGILRRLAVDLADELRTVPGTELVRLFGDPREEITVSLQPDRLAALGLSAGSIADILRRADVKDPAGILHGRTTDQSLEIEGEFEGLERIRSVPLMVREGDRTVRLRDVARVDKQWRQPPSSMAFANGRRTVLVAARMESGQQIGSWARQANEILDQYRNSLGSNVELTSIFDQNKYTQDRLAGLGWNLLAGALVVMSVVFVLMGWRRSLIVGSALPLVASAVLIGMLLLDGALHQISIFGMIIALGLLIDNAIVVVDEVRKGFVQGLDSTEAVQRAFHHIYSPLLASTLTTVFGFMPILLLSGNAGDFVRWIGGSVILAIISSYVISLTLILALAGLFGNSGTNRYHWWSEGLRTPRLRDRFEAVLRWGLDRPVLAVALVLLVPMSGFAAVPFMGNQFFPKVSRDMFNIEVWHSRQTGIEQTRRTTRKVTQTLREIPAIQDVHWMVGGSFPSFYYNMLMNKDRTPYYAQAQVTTRDPEDVSRILSPLQAHLNREIPAARVLVNRLSQGPPVQADVQYRLYGPDIDRLQELGRVMRRHLQDHPQVLHTTQSYVDGFPKLEYQPDDAQVRSAGLSRDALAARLRAKLDGAMGGSLFEGRENLSVRVRWNRSSRRSRRQIESGYVMTREGPIPLSSLGDFELRSTLAGLTHYDGLRTNMIEGFVRADALPIEVSEEVLATIQEDLYPLPEGYSIELGGKVEADREARSRLATYAPVLLVLLFASLILAFRSFRMATLLITVAGTTVGFGLLSTAVIGYPISFNTIMSTIGLIGVGINDSIIVLAELWKNKQAREGDQRAIIAGVMGCTRHVLSTTFTTMGGFLPLLIFVGGYFWTSLSIVFVLGIFGTTLLALLFVPFAFHLVTRKGQLV